MGPTNITISPRFDDFADALRYPTASPILSASLSGANVLGDTFWVGLPAGGSATQPNCNDWSSSAAVATLADPTVKAGALTGATQSCSTGALRFVCLCNTDPSLPPAASPTPRPSIPVSVLLTSTAIFSGHAARHWGAVMSPSGALKMLGANYDNELGMDAYHITTNYANWGLLNNQLGNHLPFTQLPSTVKIATGAAGKHHTCVVDTTGAVRCWGNNFVGQLGQGHTDKVETTWPLVNLNGQNAKSLSAGEFHTCAVTADGAARCWGLGDSFQLGNGDADINIGADHGTLPIPPARLGNVKIVAVAAGNAHTCFLTDKGRVKCVGLNDRGQCGVQPQTPAFPDNIGILKFGTGDNLAFLNLTNANLPATAIAAGAHHTAVIIGGKVKVWGWNSVNQLGSLQLAGTQYVGRNGTDMGDALPFVSLGTGVVATQVGCGEFHTCVLLTTGAVKCFGGLNQYGELGQGNSLPYTGTANGLADMGNLQPRVMLGSGLIAKQIAVGKAFACALLSPGSLVKCWGTGDDTESAHEEGDGALGQGFGIEVIGNTAGQMNDNLRFINLGQTPTKMPTPKPVSG